MVAGTAAASAGMIVRGAVSRHTLDAFFVLVIVWHILLGFCVSIYVRVEVMAEGLSSELVMETEMENDGGWLSGEGYAVLLYEYKYGGRIEGTNSQPVSPTERVDGARDSGRTPSRGKAMPNGAAHA
jgi:hypothetical protein